jgi:hypothetical protein
MTIRPISPILSGSSELDLFLDPFAPAIINGRKPQVSWRFVLCDLNGFPISIITALMQNTTMTFLLNRPSTLSFQVPSDDDHFNTLYFDDFPYLACGNRIIKAYRKIETDKKWKLRYVGRVWNIQDTGDGNVVSTTVTCYDSLQELNSRIVRNDAGSFHKTVKFWPHGTTNPGNKYSYGTAIKEMIDRTNTHGARPTTIDTGGYWDPEIFGGSINPAASSKLPLLAYNQAKILPSMVTITDTALVDLEVTYLDTNSDPSKNPIVPAPFLRLGASAQVGSLGQIVSIFGYAAAPKNTASMTRTQDMTTFANDVTLYGASNRGRISHQVDSGSGLDTYGAFEDVIVESSIHTKILLDDLANEILKLRKKPRELVNFIPLPELAPLPWDDWNLGDTVQVHLGIPKSHRPGDKNPLTRESRIGKQRVYGFTIGIEENYSEHVTAMILSADAEPTV